jgi:hypothetical protein
MPSPRPLTRGECTKSGRDKSRQVAPPAARRRTGATCRLPPGCEAPIFEADASRQAPLHRRSRELTLRRMEPAGVSLREPEANRLNRSELRGSATGAGMRLPRRKP